MEATVGELTLDWIIGGFECQQRGLSGILVGASDWESEGGTVGMM